MNKIKKEDKIPNDFINVVIAISPNTLLDIPYIPSVSIDSNNLKDYINFIRIYLRNILAIDLNNNAYKKFIRECIVQAINMLVQNDKKVKERIINKNSNTFNEEWVKLINNEYSLELLYILSSDIDIKNLNLKDMEKFDKNILSIDQTIAIRVYHNFLNQFSQYTANDNYIGLVKMCKLIDDEYHKINTEGKLLHEEKSLEQRLSTIKDQNLKSVFNGLIRFIKNLNNYLIYNNGIPILLNRPVRSGISHDYEKKIVLHDVKLRVKSPSSINLKIGLKPESDIRGIKDFIGVMFIIEKQEDIFLLIDILREIGFLDPHVVLGQKHDLNLLRRIGVNSKKEALKKSYKNINNTICDKMIEIISSIKSDKENKLLSTFNIKSLFFYMTQDVYTGKTVTKDIPFEIQVYTAPSNAFIQFCLNKYKCKYDQIPNKEKTRLIYNFILDKKKENLDESKIEKLLLDYFGSYFLYLYHPIYGHEIYKQKQIEQFNNRSLKYANTPNWLEKLLKSNN